MPRAAAEGLSVQRFLVESALPEGRPSLLVRRALCREFLAVARDRHGACVNLNQLTHIAHVRRDVPSGADEVMAEVRAGGRRIVELAALLSARGGGPPGGGRRDRESDTGPSSRRLTYSRTAPLTAQMRR